MPVGLLLVRHSTGLARLQGERVQNLSRRGPGRLAHRQTQPEGQEVE